MPYHLEFEACPLEAVVGAGRPEQYRSSLLHRKAAISPSRLSEAVARALALLQSRLASQEPSLQINEDNRHYCASLQDAPLCVAALNNPAWLMSGSGSHRKLEQRSDVYGTAALIALNMANSAMLQLAATALKTHPVERSLQYFFVRQQRESLLSACNAAHETVDAYNSWLSEAGYRDYTDDTGSLNLCVQRNNALNDYFDYVKNNCNEIAKTLYKLSGGSADGAGASGRSRGSKGGSAAAGAAGSAGGAAAGRAKGKGKGSAGAAAEAVLSPAEAAEAEAIKQMAEQVLTELESGAAKAKLGGYAGHCTAAVMAALRQAEMLVRYCDEEAAFIEGTVNGDDELCAESRKKMAALVRKLKKNESGLFALAMQLPRPFALSMTDGQNALAMVSQSLRDVIAQFRPVPVNSDDVVSASFDVMTTALFSALQSEVLNSMHLMGKGNEGVNRMVDLFENKEYNPVLTLYRQLQPRIAAYAKSHKAVRTAAHTLNETVTALYAAQSDFEDIKAQHSSAGRELEEALQAVNCKPSVTLDIEGADGSPAGHEFMAELRLIKNLPGNGALPDSRGPEHALAAMVAAFAAAAGVPDNHTDGESVDVEATGADARAQYRLNKAVVDGRLIESVLSDGMVNGAPYLYPHAGSEDSDPVEDYQLSVSYMYTLYMARDAAAAQYREQLKAHMGEWGSDIHQIVRDVLQLGTLIFNQFERMRNTALLNRSRRDWSPYPAKFIFPFQDILSAVNLRLASSMWFTTAAALSSMNALRDDLFLEERAPVPERKSRSKASRADLTTAQERELERLEESACVAARAAGRHLPDDNSTRGRRKVIIPHPDESLIADTDALCSEAVRPLTALIALARDHMPGRLEPHKRSSAHQWMDECLSQDIEQYQSACPEAADLISSLKTMQLACLDAVGNMESIATMPAVMADHARAATAPEVLCGIDPQLAGQLLPVFRHRTPDREQFEELCSFVSDPLGASVRQINEHLARNQDLYVNIALHTHRVNLYGFISRMISEPGLPRYFYNSHHRRFDFPANDEALKNWRSRPMDLADLTTTLLSKIPVYIPERSSRNSQS